MKLHSILFFLFKLPGEKVDALLVFFTLWLCIKVDVCILMCLTQEKSHSLLRWILSWCNPHFPPRFGEGRSILSSACGGQQSAGIWLQPQTHAVGQQKCTSTICEDRLIQPNFSHSRKRRPINICFIFAALPGDNVLISRICKWFTGESL